MKKLIFLLACASLCLTSCGVSSIEVLDENDTKFVVFNGVGMEVAAGDIIAVGRNNHGGLYVCSDPERVYRRMKVAE